MIAADTSTWISFFGGEQGDDVLALARALQARQVVMPPPVLTELLSDPELSASVAHTLLELPLVALKDGFWHRAGRLRAKVLARKRKARLGDALIAQCCIDADIALITRDGDFKAFSTGLNLL
jgi:predicted nucleic acid-binding protein